ncbi:hypothetical protein ACP26L_22815 [Paenibacillus sp. S-38]|uniref:hypothetical protein n=1 Tax=Paenibacillus sp. S-38 TaxID=3416710 RepID=UPI003CEAADAA
MKVGMNLHKLDQKPGQGRHKDDGNQHRPHVRLELYPKKGKSEHKNTDPGDKEEGS